MQATLSDSGDLLWTCLTSDNPKMRIISGFAGKGMRLEDKPYNKKYAYTLRKSSRFPECVEAVEANTLIDKWGCFYTDDKIPFDDNCQSISIDLWKEADWM